MRPNTLHFALTVGDQIKKEHAAIVSGGHFYNSATLHRTLMGRWRQARWDLHVTNNTHDQSDQWIQWMLFFAATHWYQWRKDNKGNPPDLLFKGQDLECLIFMCENVKLFDRIRLIRAMEGPPV
jgi:hypothetical protein